MVCKSVNDIFHFKRRDTNKMFNIVKGPFDSKPNHVSYLQNRFSHARSTKAKFRDRVNNYKSAHRKFKKKYVQKDLAIAI